MTWTRTVENDLKPAKLVCLRGGERKIVPTGGTS